MERGREREKRENFATIPERGGIITLHSSPLSLSSSFFFSLVNLVEGHDVSPYCPEHGLLCRYMLVSTPKLFNFSARKHVLNTIQAPNRAIKHIMQ